MTFTPYQQEVFNKATKKLRAGGSSAPRLADELLQCLDELKSIDLPKEKVCGWHYGFPPITAIHILRELVDGRNHPSIALNYGLSIESIDAFHEAQIMRIGCLKSMLELDRETAYDRALRQFNKQCQQGRAA